jgi:DNA modification methylase
MCTITSPPYGGMKNYGHEDQIGFGQPYDEYLVEMRRVFRSLYQHTKPEGSLWVVSDTLRNEKERRKDRPAPMEPLPFQLAREAAESGWILRETVIWQKHKTLPWTSGGRLRNAFEYVMLFVKSNKYKFYSDRLRDPENLQEWWVKWPERYNPNGKVPTNVWEIPVPQQGSWGSSKIQHVCPLPPDLVERLLFLSTDPGDVVFDPFAGTGVVVAEANRLGRRGIGIELNRSYVRTFETIVVPDVIARNKRDVVQERMSRAADLRERILRLRAMKYPKTLWMELAKLGTMASPQVIVVLLEKPKPDTLTDPLKPLRLKVLFMYEAIDADATEAVARALKEVASRAPANKFGISAEVLVGTVDELSMHVPARQPLYLYPRGRTWESAERVRKVDLGTLRPEATQRVGRHRYPPIVGNVEVQETPGLAP